MSVMIGKRKQGCEKEEGEICGARVCNTSSLRLYKIVRYYYCIQHTCIENF
jgi:hypothetical protein